MDNSLLTSIIALTGVIIGTTLSSLNNHVLKRKETKLRVLEKILDKRIKAHEEILSLVKKTRSVIGTGKKDEDSNVISYPSCMESFDHFSLFLQEMFQIIHQNSHWLNTDLQRELSFFQDYLVTIYHQVSEAGTDSDIIKTGVIVKQDFVNLAMSIENITFQFFRHEITKLRINKLDEWHKYPKEETNKRFSKTELMTRSKEIEKIIKG
ncbi:hypothetical protein BXY85_0464 [Roseivirga pacifica]|uniref:Uncharacterized protein n=1 Tax=Roseivirga pacifica TaxID=1267423 RepID=A0A1I0RSN1_9BACT|nr:hypothetical protein [Roseivirga pacifica]RKQ49475.1 hypothetical protein BXY85_0464 [Roseivirga pacifica]SEW44239.1 hypothetical protein SAMN05216290_4053 [Roseivirga pacifica]